MSATVTPNARTAVPHAKTAWTCADRDMSTPPRYDARAALARALEAPPRPAAIDTTNLALSPFADDPRLAELLALLHLGRLAERVGARVAEIVRDNPPDALERLERAAAYIGVTDRDADHLTQLAAEFGPTPARDYLAATLQEVTA